MNITDLKSLSSKLQQQFNDSDALQMFKKFNGQIVHVLQQGNRGQNTGDSRNALFKSLESFDDMALTYNEERLYRLLEYDKLVGAGGIEAIDIILHDENFDPAGVVSKIQEKLKKFIEFYTAQSQLSAYLGKFPSIEKIKLDKNERRLQISFLDATAVETIIDFEKCIDIWILIIRAFSEYAGNRPEDVRIVSVHKSSPLVIDFASGIGIVFLISKAVDMVLGKVERYVKILKEMEEVKKLKLKNKRIALDLKAAGDEFADASASEIVEKLLAGKGKKVDGAVKTHLIIAVKKLFDFIDKGGRVDSPDVETDKELGQVIKNIRKLQQSIDKIKLLEAPKK